MWFSDRPRSQQRLADDMAGLLEIVRDHNFFQFLDAFWVIMGREWDGLDQHRIDKFLLLLRRYVAGTFRRLRAEDWQDDWLEGYQIVMAHVPLNPKDSKVPNAIRLHMTDIFLDELEKIVSENDGPDGIPFEALLKPVRDLAQDCPLKFVRERTTKDVLEDPRLVEWGVVDLPQTNEPHQDSDTDDSEWGGLN
jgi:ribosomal RNA-processing protein 1